jgi:hypothetical protein
MQVQMPDLMSDPATRLVGAQAAQHADNLKPVAPETWRRTKIHWAVVLEVLALQYTR